MNGSDSNAIALFCEDSRQKKPLSRDALTMLGALPLPRFGFFPTKTF